VESNIQLEEYASSKLSAELRNWYTTHFTGLSVKDVEMEPEESVRRAVQVISKRYDIVGFQDDLPTVAHKLRKAAHLYRPFDNRVLKAGKRIGLNEVPENVRITIAEVNFLDVKLYALLKAHGGGISGLPNLVRRSCKAQGGKAAVRNRIRENRLSGIQGGILET
jgi:hypothetical protein